MDHLKSQSERDLKDLKAVVSSITNQLQSLTANITSLDNVVNFRIDDLQLITSHWKTALENMITSEVTALKSVVDLHANQLESSGSDDDDEKNTNETSITGKVLK